MSMHNGGCCLVFGLFVDNRMRCFSLKKMELGHKGGAVIANVLATT